MEITVTRASHCVIVSVKGRIDSYTASKLSETLQEIAEQGIFQIILNLQDVVYVSSAGLRVFIDAQKTCQNKGELALVNVPERVLDTLELVGFTSLFRFYPNVQIALEQIQKQ